MNSKKVKAIRKSLGYDLRAERKDGRQYFNLVSKNEKIKNFDGTESEKYCGIISSEIRRKYQIMKKYSKGVVFINKHLEFNQDIITF